MSDDFTLSTPLLGESRGQNQEGIREEVANLYRIRHQQVLRVVLSSVPDLAAAEEVTQEAFFRLYQHRIAGGVVDNVLAWTLAVARNLVRDRARERKREDVVPQEKWDTLFERHADSSLSSERLILDREARDRLALLVDLLPERQRNCVRLYGQGFNFKEIGVTLGLPYHHVLVQIRNGLDRVKRLLTQDRK
jgi:RNA polymerase sigma-70 factor, ECF subfamily